jgi:IMP dehydrogenase/GMP reductase
VQQNEEKMPKYKVPQNIVKIAQRAIDYNLSLPISRRAAYKDEGKKRVPGTGMRTARRLASGAIDEQQMILMRSWFARHAESPGEKEARRDKTSKASIAWRLWGSNEARRWVSSRLRELERAREKKNK